MSQKNYAITMNMPFGKFARYLSAIPKDFDLESRVLQSPFNFASLLR